MRRALVDGDEIIYIIAASLHRQGHMEGGVVGTLMTNLGLEKALAAAEIPMVRTKVGDRYVVEAMEQNNGLWVVRHQDILSVLI